MELQARCMCVIAMLLVAGLAGLAHGAGECGRQPADRVALKLAPCAAATQNPRAPVPPACCAQVRAIGRNPKCLCAVMLSGTARKAGVKPAVAMTIPKRCAIANRPIGYKCGRKGTSLILFVLIPCKIITALHRRQSLYLFCSFHRAAYTLP